MRGTRVERAASGEMRASLLSALLGAVVWLVGCPLLEVSLTQAWLLLAPLVLVPLGWELLTRSAGAAAGHSLARWTARLQLPAALLLAASFGFVQATPAALLLAVPWLLWTLSAALLGAWRLWTPDLRSLAAVTRSVGLLYLAGAGTWTLITRGGWRPLGFDAEIVRLTAMHLHYVGFVLPVLAALLHDRRKATATTLACLGGILGFPLVASAMTMRQLGGPGGVELASVTLFAATCLALAFSELRWALHVGQPAPLVLWLISGVSLASAMVLALIYCHGVVSGSRWLDIPQMAISHGLLNAVGFALAGLLGGLASTRD